ncbi:unnamed protein product [Rhizophagus irregularis]|nr:unnamed protein product [Rhizophagus irregularis]
MSYVRYLSYVNIYIIRQELWQTAYVTYCRDICCKVVTLKKRYVCNPIEAKVENKNSSKVQCKGHSQSKNPDLIEVVDKTINDEALNDKHKRSIASSSDDSSKDEKTKKKNHHNYHY